MKMLSDERLLESYSKAVELQLDQEFIELLLTEIHRRKLLLPNLRKASAI